MSPEFLITNPELQMTLEGVIEALHDYLQEYPDLSYKDEFVDHIEGANLTQLWADALKLMGKPKEVIDLSKSLGDLILDLGLAQPPEHRFEAEIKPVIAVADRAIMPESEEERQAPSFIVGGAKRQGVPYLRVLYPIKPDFSLDRTRPIQTTFSNPLGKSRFLNETIIFNPNEVRAKFPGVEAGVGLQATRKFSELLLESAEKTLAERNGATTSVAD